jgi:hypothetical protein
MSKTKLSSISVSSAHKVKRSTSYKVFQKSASNVKGHKCNSWLEDEKQISILSPVKPFADTEKYTLKKNVYMMTNKKILSIRNSGQLNIKSLRNRTKKLFLKNKQFGNNPKLNTLTSTCIYN